MQNSRILSMSKIGQIVLIFFSLKIKKGDQHLLATYFDKFDFLFTLLLKMGPIFVLRLWNERKAKNIFIAVYVVF